MPIVFRMCFRCSTIEFNAELDKESEESARSNWRGRSGVAARSALSPAGRASNRNGLIVRGTTFQLSGSWARTTDSKISPSARMIDRSIALPQLNSSAAPAQANERRESGCIPFIRYDVRRFETLSCRSRVTRDGSRTSHYDFELPVDRIAQFPTERRGESRLMVVNRSTGEIAHKQFSDLEQMIPGGDAIVLNTTRVFRARLLGVRDNGTPAEILLLRSLGNSMWEAMVHPGGKLKPGRIVKFAD